MTVYVDDARNPYGRMLMSHMIADNSEELFEMACKVSVSTRWVQHRGTYKEHFDVCQERRLTAIAMGAVKVTAKELCKMLLERRRKLLASKQR